MRSVVFISFLFLISSPTVYAKKLIATAAKVRGTVTVLHPGALHARKIVIGQKLYEDSSILSHEKSFVQVKYLDGSTLNLGPKSKMVLVELNKKTGVGVVSLLKGKMRATIQKKNDGRPTKNKFFVKTRTAALGVRGTEFETMYNPENEATSLVTFEGKVAIAKVDNEVIEKQEKRKATIEEEKVEEEKVEKVKKDWKSNRVDSKTLDNLLDTKDAVVVKQGQFSGVTTGLQKTTLPVKISPKQFTVLYHNKDFKKVDKSKLKKIVKQVDQDAPLEGYKNDKTGDFAPRAGGYIDPQTALYIPPKNTAKLNKKLKVYEAEGVGNMDISTGAYIPPTGLKLDAKKGFIIDKNFVEKSGADINKTELVVMKESMNKTIEADIIFKKEEKEVVVYAPTFAQLFQRNTFIYELIPYESIWRLNKVEQEGLYARQYNNDSRVEHRFTWNHISEGNWQLGTTFSIKDSNADSNIWDLYADSISDGKLYRFALNLNYILTLNSQLTISFALNQDFYGSYYYSSDDSMYYYRTEKVSLMKFMTSYQIRYFRYKRFFMDTAFTLGFSKPKESGSVELGVQGIAQLDFGFNYWLGKTYSMRFGGWTSYETGKISGAVVSAVVSREDSGAKLTMGMSF